jgi:hypothetical protein
MSKGFRKAAAVLLVTIAATLAGAAPSHARTSASHRAFVDPSPTSARSFLVSILIEIFDYAGGAMDPNGKH